MNPKSNAPDYWEEITIKIDTEEIVDRLEQSIAWIKRHRDSVDKNQIYQMLTFIINQY